MLVSLMPSAKEADQGCVDYVILPPGSHTTADTKDQTKTQCPKDGPIVIPAYE